MDKNKSEEIHFTVGEALSCVASGSESSAAKDPLHPSIDDIEDEEEKKENKGKQGQQGSDASTADQKPVHRVPELRDVEFPEVMVTMLAKLFSLLQSGSNVSRASAAIWLLSLLQHSSTHRELRPKLPLVQAHFSHLLSGISSISAVVFLHLTIASICNRQQRSYPRSGL